MPDVRMSHPTSQQLTDYGLGKLPREKMSVIENHLVSCADCRRVVENLSPDSFIGKLRATAPRGGTQLPRPASVPSAAAKSASGTSIPQHRTKPRSDDAVPPELLASSKFQILGLLGRGGMGSVWKARHNFLNQLVAIKVMNPGIVADSEARSRFLREMQAAGQLQHKNIVRALDAEQIGDLLILVMEFVAGITLDRLVAQRGPLAVDFSCLCIVQAAQGLQHAHEKGMVHRDIKPANLIITPKEKEVKLLDFGLARGPREQMDKTNQTQVQMFMGTPQYVAPEQASDARSADVRADIYSLGCTLYCLLAGRPPFEADTSFDTILAQIHDEALPLPELRTDLPAALWEVVAKMIAKDPVARYQTPIEAAQALRPFIKQDAKPGAKSDSAPALGVDSPGKGTTIAADTSRLKKVLRCEPGMAPPKQVPATDDASPFEELADTSALPWQANGARESSRSRRPIWAVGIAAALLTVAVFAGIVLTLRTPRGGPVVVEIDQADAEVFVDGKKQQINIRVPGEKETIEITVKDDKEHILEVTKGGFQTDTRNFTYTTVKGKPIHVYLTPVIVPPVKRKVIVEIDQAGTDVMLDGKKIGTVEAGTSKRIEVRVNEGKHALAVKKDGFEPFALDFTSCKDDEDKLIRVTMKKAAPSSSAEKDVPGKEGDTALPKPTLRETPPADVAPPKKPVLVGLPVAEEAALARRGLGVRSADLREKLLRAYGANARSQKAVADGLKFLALHQCIDGHWSLHDFDKHARTAPLPGGKVEADNSQTNTTQVNNTAGTAFGLLAFLANGMTHKAPKNNPEIDYSNGISRALRYLLVKQTKFGNDRGYFGEGMYAHGLATFAICEAYGLTADPQIKASAQMALNYIVAAQDRIGGGWRYAPGQRGDTSVTSWQLQALRSGQLAGLSVPRACLLNARTYLESCESLDKGGYGYLPRAGETISMSAAGALCRLRLAVQPASPSLQGSVRRIKANPPGSGNRYYEYYASLVMFHAGGEAWEFWYLGPDGTGKGGIRDLLIDSQDSGAEGRPGQAGSWAGTANVGGRIGATVFNLLILQVPYRYPRLYRGAL